MEQAQVNPNSTTATARPIPQMNQTNQVAQNAQRPTAQANQATRIAPNVASQANQMRQSQTNPQGVAIDPNISQPFIDEQMNSNIGQLKVDVNKLDFAVTRKVRTYLKKLIDMGGSDLHIKAGSQIRARINGDIIVFSNDIFSKEDAITLAKELTRTRYPEFVKNKEMDMTYIYDATSRFRLNIFFQMEGVSFAFRTIPTIQNTIDGLGLPEAIHKITDMERGLVLVTGITGSGKSTTLAAIINEINHKYAKHIITIEDPIEFVHKDIKSIINQRSVGMDTNSFANALKAALREDPDIILVGEMRDIETIEMALHAAETGHLVLSTLHTLERDDKSYHLRFPSHRPSADSRYAIKHTKCDYLTAIA